MEPWENQQKEPNQGGYTRMLVKPYVGWRRCMREVTCLSGDESGYEIHEHAWSTDGGILCDSGKLDVMEVAIWKCAVEEEGAERLSR